MRGTSAAHTGPETHRGSLGPCSEIEDESPFPGLPCVNPVPALQWP